MSERPECDIVMKGGITSGVVYPLAAVELSETYTFRSIGGTSAGAIAAAVVAAAEHGRRVGGGGGFDVVRRLPDTLAQTVDGRPFMLQLFQPDPATRPLFDVAMGAMAPDRMAGVGAALRRSFPSGGAAGAAGSVAGGAGRLWHRVRPRSAVARALADLAPAAGSVRAAWAAAQALGANDFGLCRLGPDADAPGRPALTAWLHAQIQEAAGRAPGDPVLSFADLWGAPPLADPGDAAAVAARRARLRALSTATGTRAVDLQMMTTDLTHGRPWRLPVPFQPAHDRLEDGGTLLYDPAELAHFFPADVLAHLAQASACDPFGERTTADLAALGKAELRRFPIGPDLPVVVGTRMSLSFPVLISAIPLYELVHQADPAAPTIGRVGGVRRVYFSDGGISSNFPVHFFDSPLPRRPTFGLQLTSYAPGEPPATDPRDAVVEPPAPSGRVPVEARAIEDLGGFFGAIKDAMQNWRDNAQSQLPGFRDRIVRIKLATDEGGLNLGMTPEQIRSLTERGAIAGQVLVRRFAEDEPGLDYAKQWDDHRFVRFRTTMSMLERLLGQYAGSYDEPVPHARPYDERVAAGATTTPYPFGSRRRTEAARSTAEGIRSRAAAIDPADSLDDAGVPRPPSVLRAVPPT